MYVGRTEKLRILHLMVTDHFTSTDTMRLSIPLYFFDSFLPYTFAFNVLCNLLSALLIHGVSWVSCVVSGFRSPLTLTLTVVVVTVVFSDGISTAVIMGSLTTWEFLLPFPIVNRPSSVLCRYYYCSGTSESPTCTSVLLIFTVRRCIFDN